MKKKHKRKRMDFQWLSSLNLEESTTWENVTSFGKTPLKAAQQATLIRLKYPRAPYKYTQRTHRFKLKLKSQ